MDILVTKSEGKYSIALSGLYADDFQAFVSILEQSGTPQFEAAAAVVREQGTRESAYYEVETQRDRPYVESINRVIEDFDEARRYAREQAQLDGVRQVVIWDDRDNLVDTFTGEVD